MKNLFDRDLTGRLFPLTMPLQKDDKVPVCHPSIDKIQMQERKQ
jgi:hypothetical protein